MRWAPKRQKPQLSLRLLRAALRRHRMRLFRTRAIFYPMRNRSLPPPMSRPRRTSVSTRGDRLRTADGGESTTADSLPVVSRISVACQALTGRRISRDYVLPLKHRVVPGGGWSTTRTSRGKAGESSERVPRGGRDSESETMPSWLTSRNPKRQQGTSAVVNRSGWASRMARSFSMGDSERFMRK